MEAGGQCRTGREAGRARSLRSRDKRCQSRLETRGQRKALEPGPNAQLAMQIPSDEDDEGKGTKRKRRKKDVRARVVMSCAFGGGKLTAPKAALAKARTLI